MPEGDLEVPMVEDQPLDPPPVGIPNPVAQAIPIIPNPIAPVISPRHLTLIKLFTSQTNTLTRFKASKGELWRSFETTFRIKWANSSLDEFPVPMQKMALLGCLEGAAAKAHILLAEGSDGWRIATTIDLFLDQVRYLFNPPEE